MEKSRRNSMFLRILALMLAIGLLVGAVPVSAVESEAEAEEESTSSAVEEIPAQEETEFIDEQQPEDDDENKADNDSDKLSHKAEVHLIADEEDENEDELIESKEDEDLAATAEAPSGVTIDVEEGRFESYLDYYYTGIEYIRISFTKPEDLPEEKIKVAFDKDLSETEDYDRVDWWDDYSNLPAYRDLYVYGNDVEIVMDIESFVDFRYNSEGFSDGKADGIYTLVFSYDIDGDDNPILYSQDFMITNEKPVVKVVSTDGNISSDSDKWVSDKGKIKYEASAVPGVGVKKVYLGKSDYDNYDRSTHSSGTFSTTASGHYYLLVKDNLNQMCEKKVDAGEIQIESEDPTVDKISYTDGGDPSDPDDWSGKEETHVTITVKTGGSDVTEVKPAGEKSINPNSDGSYTLKFTDRTDKEVTIKTAAGKKAIVTIPAPQIDTKKPNKNSITHIDFTAEETDKIINLLTFGLYGNKELKMTVYTEDESAIKDIEIENNEEKPNKITPDKDTVREGNKSSRTFTIPAGSNSEDSNFSDINIKLTDLAENTSTETIGWKDIKRFTASSKSAVDELENKDASVKELVNTKLTPSVKNFSIAGEKAEENPGYYRNNVEITADIEESLSGIESVKAYFGTENDITFNEETNQYEVKESAKSLNDKLNPSKKDGDKIISYRLDYKPNDDDLPTGKYIVLIEAVNNSGNPMQQTEEFFIDKKAPKVTITSPSDDTEWAPDNKITFTVTDLPEKNNVGVGEVTVKSQSESTVVEDEDGDGVYEFDPDEGENYTIVAKDLLGNEVETDENTLTYDKIKKDEQDPHISELKSCVKIDGKLVEMTEDQWSKEVYISFTVDDKYNGTTLSGIDTSSFVVTKKGSNEPLSVKVSPIESEENPGTYNCSFKAPLINTAYTVTVKDIAKNESAKSTEAEVKFDNTAPIIEKIVISGYNGTPYEFGMYGQDSLLLTVYTKSGHSAPVSEIDLFNGTDPVSPKDDKVHKSDDDKYFIKTFYLKDVNDKNGTVYNNLMIKAKSAAGVGADAGMNSVNVYADGVDKEFDKFLEAVAKLSGPAIELEGEDDGEAFAWKYPEERIGSEGDTISGYTYDDDGVFDGNYGTFSFMVKDPIAGVNSGSINVYFDKADKENFTQNEDGVYMPTGKAAKLLGYDKTWETDNTEAKNTWTKCVYQPDKATLSGEYILCVQADNLSGVTKTVSKKFYVDNDAPDITDIKFDGKEPKDAKWSQNEVKVTFDVKDMPNGKNGGIKKVTVVGERDGKAIKQEDFEISGSKYSFTTGVSQEYTITAWDNFNNKYEVTTDRVLTDMYDPHVTISAADLDDYKGTWSPDTKLITFTVDDICDYGDFKKAEYKNLSGIQSVTVKGVSKNAPPYEAVKKSGTDHKAVYTFVADYYQSYKIIVEDNAGRFTVYEELTNIKVDTAAPTIDEVRFEKKQPSTGERILNFLSFGVFGNKDATIKVKGTDPYASSSIKKVVVRFEDANEKEKEKTATTVVTGGDPDEATINATIDVPNELISNSQNISVEIFDNVDHTSTEQSLYKLYGDGKVKVEDGFKINKQDFEVVITERAPKITNISVYPNDEGDKDKEGYDSTKTFESRHDGKYWYNKRNFSIDFTAVDDISKLHSIDAYVNGTNITDSCYEGGTENKLDSVYTNFEKGGDHNDEYVEKRSVTVDASNLDSDDLNYVSQGDSANTFSFTATGNNGIPHTENAPSIYIDNVAPDITAFSFADTVDENSREKVDKTETKEISDALAKAGSEYHTMTSDNYVYFFQDGAEVTVSATDTHSGIEGSGVREIHFYAVGRTDVDDDIGIVKRDEKIVGDNYGNMSATFSIPAGFKGSIFAYAVDQVKNYGSQYSPNNLVVENSDIHDSSSDVDITVNTESVATDNNDHPLYDRDVNLTLTIEDQFSGIRSVSYSCIGREESAVLEGSAFVDGDGDVSDDLGSWDINETDKNLVLNMSRTITLDGDGAFNSNDIEIKISGYDCSGYKIAEESKIISIDTTKPEIEVSYSPVKGSGNTYGSDIYEYYKESRTMSVTVYERNFDPNGFDYSGIVNKYVTGDVPGLSAGDNWNTSYSDYSDSSVHTCSFTFANDGDYEITLNCTDEAGNKADEYVGENFTIDTIDPTIEVSLSGTAKNGKYYNETVTATVTIHEHNFAEGDTYVTFTPKNDYDTSYDKSSSTPSISGWSGSGDTHTTTIDFSSDGTYSFTFDYKDKALRSAQQFSQTEFVVDKNIDKLIKFVDVEDTTAYDGKIEPKVKFDDTNLDTVSSTMTRISLDTTDMKKNTSPAENLKHTLNPATGSSRTDSYENFPEELVNDGIYEFEASGTDLAGNTKSEKILFSVNRFGSTFMLSPESREWVETGYVNRANQLDVIEINVNEVKEQNVSVTRNSHTETLKDNLYKISSSGDNENWYKYNYNVYDTNFSNDGEYTVTVSSVDTFKKSVSNRTAVNDEKKGIEKNCPISFVMDTDVPIIQIDGIESDTPYGDPERTVNIICADPNIKADTLVIKDDDEELVSGVDYSVEEPAGELDIELIVDDPGKHTLSVYVADKATNNNTDEVVNFELNASIFTLFFHNTVAVICTAIGLAALIVLVVFLILRKKKKEEEAKTTPAAK